MNVVVLCAAVIFAGCAADRPTAAPKILLQDFSCGRALAVQDTAIKAVAPDSNLRLEISYHDTLFFDNVYVYGRRSDGTRSNVEVVFYIAERAIWDDFRDAEFAERERFTEPACNARLEALLLEERISSTHKIEAYACAVRQINSQIQGRLLDPNCGLDCWGGLETKRKAAQDFREFYEDELRYANFLDSWFFDDCE